jgi:hypothetical protein
VSADFPTPPAGIWMLLDIRDNLNGQGGFTSENNDIELTHGQKKGVLSLDPKRLG